MHPFLVPGAWLLEGNYFPTGKTPQRVSGVTQTRASEAFPETIEVQGEIRDADDPTSKPVLSTFHLDVVGRQQVRFRMDSIPLGTVLLGRGFYDDAAMALQYASPDRRILGFESYTSCGEGVLRTTGVLLADGALVTSWLAKLERIAAGTR
ncbi:MAG: hypothetical protein HXY19_03325 [Thermoanaerobaculaceae bacterium]|nr:hypothetical protein [Thermoanaerobaculaceae bacterium]